MLHAAISFTLSPGAAPTPESGQFISPNFASSLIVNNPNNYVVRIFYFEFILQTPKVWVYSEVIEGGNLQRILVAGLNQNLKDKISTWLHDNGYITLVAHNLTEARNLLGSIKFDAVVAGPGTDAFVPEVAVVPVLVFESSLKEKEFLSRLRALLTGESDNAEGNQSPDTR